MRNATMVRSISYLKANAVELLRSVSEQRVPVVITQNGKAQAVLQDVTSFDEEQETLALLTLLAMGDREIEDGQFESVDDVFDRVLARRRKAAENQASPSQGPR